LGPAFLGLELGIGDSLIIKAIAEAKGKKVKTVKELYKKVGDLGEIARDAGKGVRTIYAPKPLTLKSTFAIFQEIARMKGNSVFILFCSLFTCS